MLEIWGNFPTLFPTGQPKISFAVKRAMPSRALGREGGRCIQSALPRSVREGKGNCSRNAMSHKPEGKAAPPHVPTVVSKWRSCQQRQISQ